MPPRLELMVMRTLQLSYVQARDLVKDSRNELNMKSTDPWTEELKEYCNALYNERLVSGYYQTQKQSNDDNNNISDNIIKNSTEATSTKDDKMKYDNDKDECGGDVDEDDVVKEIESEVESIVLDIDDDDGCLSAAESQSLSQPSKERNDNNEHTENFEDDDNDEDLDIRNLLLRIPSKRSIFNQSDPSMWVQPGTGSVIDSAYSVDENGQPKEDYDDIEKFMNHCLKIRTSSKKFQHNNNTSTTDDSGGDGDDSNRRGPTEQQQQEQQRSSSRLNDIPKFIYVVTVNDVPLGVIVEQMKKNCIMLRQSGGGSGYNHDITTITTGGRKIKPKPRSRSLSLGRKSFHKKLGSNNNDDSNSNSHHDCDSNKNNNNNNRDYSKSPTVSVRSIKGLRNPLSPNNNKNNNTKGNNDDDDDDENKESLSPTKRIKKLVRGRSITKTRLKMTNDNTTTTTTDETDGTTATTTNTKSPLLSIPLLTQQAGSPTKKKRSVSLGRRNFIETLQSSISNLGKFSSQKMNNYNDDDNDEDDDDDNNDIHDYDNDNNKYDVNDNENSPTSTSVNTNRNEQKKDDTILIVDKQTKNQLPVLIVT